MRILLLTITIICITFSLRAQDAAPTTPKDTNSYWKKGGLFNVSFSQTALVNWAAGGEENVSSTVLLKLFANYAKNKWIWNNDLTIGYGGLLKGRSPWEKTDDRIELNSKVGREAKKNWYYSAFLNFRTQMTDGFKLPDDSTLISTWMAPAYLTMGVGFDYLPNDYFSMNIAPAATKLTVVGHQGLADFGAYGVEKAERDSAGVITKAGENYRLEFGGNLTFQFKKDIFKNVNLDTKLNFFSNYLHEPQNIDVNWELLLNMKVNKWLSANISTSLIYDHDIDIPLDSNNDGINDAFGPRVQFKEVLGVGLNMSF